MEYICDSMRHEGARAQVNRKKNHITPRDNAHMPASYRYVLRRVNTLRAIPTLWSQCQAMRSWKKIETYFCLSPRLIEKLLDEQYIYYIDADRSRKLLPSPTIYIRIVAVYFRSTYPNEESRGEPVTMLYVTENLSWVGLQEKAPLVDLGEEQETGSLTLRVDKD